MTEEELTLGIVDRSKKGYPDAGCTLDYNQAWKLLVSICLAVQCTDARVNMMVQDLYSQYPGVASLATAGMADTERIVKPCDLGHSRARGISTHMKTLRERYGDNVPDDFDALLKLPGVGRENTNLVMGDIFGKPVAITDIHCIRLVNRMGLVDGVRDPKKVEMALWKLMPAQEGSNLCHRSIYHGRDACVARTRPHCGKCCLEGICTKAGVME